jgi:hypothetical protein
MGVILLHEIADILLNLWEEDTLYLHFKRGRR